MNSNRPRFARTRLALGLATALAIGAFACDMPSPEALAPDGKNQVTKRLYGELPAKMQTILDQRGAATAAMVAKYFPAVSRGEGGPSILFVVRSATGDLVLTEAQPVNSIARSSEPAADETPAPEVAARERAIVGKMRERVALPSTGTPELRMNVLTRRMQPRTAFGFKVPTASGGWVPAGIGAVRPDDIDSIEISKHAAGAISPNAVSLITITLKPGAVVPSCTNR